jgi:hypothetical protein
MRLDCARRRDGLPVPGPHHSPPGSRHSGPGGTPDDVRLLAHPHGELAWRDTVMAGEEPVAHEVGPVEQTVDIRRRSRRVARDRPPDRRIVVKHQPSQGNARGRGVRGGRVRHPPSRIGCGVVNRTRVGGGVTGSVSTLRSAMASGESDRSDAPEGCASGPAPSRLLDPPSPADRPGRRHSRRHRGWTHADQEWAGVARSPVVASAAVSTAAFSSRGHWIDRSNESTRDELPSSAGRVRE